MYLFIYRESAETFATSVETTIRQQRGKGKADKMIRYYFYQAWAWKLKKRGIGQVNSHFAYPQSVLDFIRELLPQDIKGEIRHGTQIYSVSVNEFCDAVMR